MQADRKMEPWMLRDLAGLWDMPAEPRKKFSDQLREEAARREAVAKPATLKEAAAQNVKDGGCDNCPTPAGCRQEQHCDNTGLSWVQMRALLATQGERQGPDSAAAIQPFDPDMLMRWEMRPVGSDETRREHYLAVTGFTLADVHEFVRSERLTRERYNELRANLLDGGAK